jgi:glycosyltransferase involved in cell wall biosynthesis
MTNILFIFNRVAHYHEELFKTLEASLAARGITLHLLSGADNKFQVGRVGLRKKVIEKEYKFKFIEKRVGTYTLGFQSGIIGKICRIRPDMIIVTGHVGNFTDWLLIALKKVLRFKLVAWQCGYEYNPGQLKNTILRIFVPQFDHHLAYHGNAAKYARAHGANRDAVTVTHNTINEKRIKRIPKHEARNHICAKHSTLKGKQLVLFVGAILEEKKVMNIIQAMELMKRDDACLVIVGDGPYLSTLKHDCGKRDDVVFTGAVIDGVGRYFDAADMYVLPGTGGLGINEAMAHALPVISGYADGSADDLVVDGVNGYRLTSGSAEELAEHIGSLLDDRKLRLQMGARSLEMIQGVFAFESFIHRIERTIIRI